jgi:adenylate cyclase
MAMEIERRFLVRGSHWRTHVLWQAQIRQGYLVTGSDGLTLRVRLSSTGEGAAAAFLTLKAAPRDQQEGPGPSGQGLARLEFEYPIPASDGEDLLRLSGHQLIKHRHGLDLPGGDWVVDVFGGDNAPLVVAEVELERVDQVVPVPAWCVKELTGHHVCSNASLALRPFASWGEAERQELLDPDR